MLSSKGWAPLTSMKPTNGCGPGEPPGAQSHTIPLAKVQDCSSFRTPARNQKAHAGSTHVTAGCTSVTATRPTSSMVGTAWTFSPRSTPANEYNVQLIWQPWSSTGTSHSCSIIHSVQSLCSPRHLACTCGMPYVHLQTSQNSSCMLLCVKNS